MQKDIIIFLKTAVVFITIFCLVNSAFYCLLDIPTAYAVRKGYFQPQCMWKDFYRQPQQSIDLIFSGSSHCVYSFDPAVFDQALKIRSYNMGTPAQSPITGYFVLKEAFETQTPHWVIFEIFWEIYMSEHQFGNAFDNIRYMQSGKVKFEFLKQGFSSADLFSFIFPTMRYNDLLDRVIPFFLYGKSDKGLYVFKGYIGSDKTAASDALEYNNRFIGFSFNSHDIIPKREEYLKKIIALCREKNINIILVMCPVPPGSLIHIGNYRDIYDYYRNLAQSFNVDYIDYNSQQAVVWDNRDFMDDHHLNMKGAQKLSLDLVQKMQDKF